MTAQAAVGGWRVHGSLPAVTVVGLAIVASVVGAAADAETSDAGSTEVSAAGYAGTWAHLRVQAAIVDIPFGCGSFASAESWIYPISYSGAALVRCGLVDIELRPCAGQFHRPGADLRGNDRVEVAG